VAQLVIAAGGTPVASRIKAAIELHKTRTGEAHRGKGLGDIMNVIRTSGSGFLRISSDNGMYEFRYRDGKPVERMDDFRGKLMGTIVQWSIPVEKPRHGKSS
jgi:hypothetical protein